MTGPAIAWSRLRDDWLQAQADLPDDATDEHLANYWTCWKAAMVGEADTAEAVKWKIKEFVEGAEGGWREDLFDTYLDAIMADVARVAASDPVRVAWDRAKLLYDARILLGDVDHAIGALGEAETAYARLGPDEDDDGAFHRATDLYDDEYGQPGQDAALALILTPAPDVAGARLKFEVATFWDIRDEELPQPLQSLIADDIERISGVRKGGEA